jgi:hypothetical protein
MGKDARLGMTLWFFQHGEDPKPPQGVKIV